MKNAPFGGEDKTCNRWIYESEHCYAVLKPEQHTRGEAIVIMNEHRVDITDNIPKEELSDFIETINIVASRIKNVATNDESESPERIYVGILCDGIHSEHLHAHLIPRYPFTKDDESKYEEFYLKRDGEIEITRKQREKDLGGYWYVLDKEQTFYKTSYGQLETKEKIHYLEKLANDLRLVKGAKT
jgi:diadenosine tetraphosphate (Ap4A) HIT family hydrolase